MGALETLQRRKLVIEVTDTTPRYDREIKMPLYARHGIAEAWLVDLQAQAVIAHCEPSAQGYWRIFAQPANEPISPQLLPDISVDLLELWRT